MMQTNSRTYLYIFIVFFLVLEGSFFYSHNLKLDNDYKANEERKAYLSNTLPGTPIIAKAYSIYDITLGQKLYGKNDTISLPLASLAKTMSLVVALNNYKENDEVVISKKALAEDGEFGLFENEKWKADDLAKLTLVCSANDGAYALLENDSDYLNQMNSKAKRLGLSSAHFLNSTGLDISEHSAGAYASAEDANQMAIFAIKSHPTIFNVTTQPEITLKSESGFVHIIKNTDTVLGQIPNVIFSKTGFTAIAGGNLTIIFRDKMGHDIAITVLGSTFEGRFTDMEKLVNVLELSYNK